MKYHSDQSLDLKSDSCIALFSCYENPETLTEQHIRKLKVRDKETLKEFEISLTHNSVVLFSLSTNKIYQHKIVLEQAKGLKPDDSDNRWLGMTFRQSETFIQFKDGQPCLANGEVLTLANDDQAREFYSLRSKENKGMNFIYPELDYTLSPADIMIPE